MLAAPATAGAAGWSRAATLSPRGLGLGTPAVALNAAGEGVVASAGSGITSARKVRVTLVEGRRFGTARALGSGRDAAAAIAGDGTAAVAWTGRRDGLNLSLRRPGERFGAARRLARSGAEPRVAAGPGGRIAVTWLDRHRDFTRAMAAFGSADGFGAPVVLDSASFIYPIELAYDAGGDLALAWSAQALAGNGPTWTVNVIHRSPEGALGAVQEPGSGFAYDVRLARSAAGATDVSWIGNSGPESGTLGPSQTAIAPPGSAFDGPVSPEPGNRRTLGARVTTVGDALLLVYAMRRGPLRATVRQAGGAFGAGTVLTPGRAEDPQVAALADGAIVAWSQPRLRMARFTAGDWRKVAPPRGIPADSGRAMAAGGTGVLVGWLDGRGRVRAAARSF